MAKHLVPFIPMFGSLENVSGNSAECGHKGIVKICVSCHNNKNILHEITKFNARRGNLHRLKLQARLLAGNDGDDTSGSSDDEEAHMDATTLPCLVALRYPIWQVTQRRDKLYALERKATGGSKSLCMRYGLKALKPMHSRI